MATADYLEKQARVASLFKCDRGKDSGTDVAGHVSDSE